MAVLYEYRGGQWVPRLGELVEHTHDVEDVVGLEATLNALNNAISTRAPVNSPSFTGTVPTSNGTALVLTTDSRLSDSRTPTTHTHDDRYYTETEADARYVQLSGNQTIAGSKTFSSEIIGPATGNVLKVGDDARLVDINVQHVMGVVSQTDATQGGILFGTNTANFKLTGSGSVGTATGALNVTGTLSQGGTAVSLSTHLHDDRYYTETESDGRYIRQALVQSTLANQWVRFAQLGGGGKGHNRFRVWDDASDRHNHAEFLVTYTYGKTPAITVLSTQQYNVISISAIRVVKNTTFDPAYVEVLVGNLGGTLNFQTLDDDNRGNHWTLITPVAGAIPAGYTSVQVDLAENRMAHSGSLSIGGAIFSGGNQVVLTNDARLSDARTPTTHNHAASDLTATGTRNATTFLRGDNTWSVPPLAVPIQTGDPGLTDGSLWWDSDDTAAETSNASLRAQTGITGGGTVAVSGSGEVSWSQRFITVTQGTGSHFSTAGYFDIQQPAAGAVITGVGGHANVTVTAAGIPLAGWDALYYILPVGSSNASVPGNFRVATFTSALVIPENWILIAVRNGENGQFRFVNGINLSTGTSWAMGTPKAQVGLGNVDNTSDVNKPVSTAQATAINRKADATLGFELEDPDANGVYTTLWSYRPDGTLHRRSQLSGGTSPQYTTRTITYYDTAGTGVTATVTTSLTYDANGTLIGEWVL